MSAIGFAGYAALFDVADRGGDIVRAGAFARTLARGHARIALLSGHCGRRPAGAIDALAEDARGLRIAGRMPAGTALADAVAAGALSGLSFGYRTVRQRRGTFRELIDVELLEVSLVATPMQPGARIDRVWPV